jgi:hypothetical protein
MGSTGTVLVLLGVGAVVFLLVMYGFIDIPFLHTQEPDQWRIDISAATEGGTVTNIQALASVNPRGTIFVDPNTPLQVNASDFAGWAFSYWIFDNSSYGETPYVVVPAQEPNSTHTLVAVFEPKIPAFQITPNVVTTKGVTLEKILNLKLNENVTIHNIHLKLNDEYGVFTSAEVCKGWGSAGSIGQNYWVRRYTNCLNGFSVDQVAFNSESAGYASFGLEGNTDNALHSKFSISNSIASGTYNLTWEIQFTVTSGSFSEPPELIIPWQVTILG